MSARFPHTFAPAASLVLLAACTASDAPRKAGSNAMERASNPDSTQLLDPARQLYRYGSGTCRELGKLPAPWRKLVHQRYEKPGPWGRFPPGYSSVTKYPSSTTEVRLEAEYAQLGVPPANTLPGTIRRGGLLQDVAVLSLGPSLEDSSHWRHEIILEVLSGVEPGWQAQQAIPFKTHWGEERAYVPMKAPFPVSDGFWVYAAGPNEDELSPLVIISPSQRAGVHCYQNYNMPNPTCMGVILLSDDEVATIDVNYEALGMLQEVVASMIDAARAIRVDCPVDAPVA
ncbi:hypothetical protein ABXT00_06180 [Stenotrophomonas koreensis]|uniref:hypothetical protein n=1 Tax=Stenotrophomonas koreensis TaxID=266128 RepID=UPI003390E8CC